MFLQFSAKKVECAKHQWIHLVEDQPESPHAFENLWSTHGGVPLGLECTTPSSSKAHTNPQCISP